MRVAETRAEPPEVRIAGPAGVLARMSTISTLPVSVEGRSATFSSPAALVVAGTGMRLRQAFVTVSVRLEPAPVPSVAPTPAGRKATT
jgi:hypothetical protein